MTRKQVDDVLGGDEAWKHADSTTGTPRPRQTVSITTLADKAPKKRRAPNVTMIALTSTSCRLDPLTNR
jgi:hypothetical protein